MEFKQIDIPEYTLTKKLDENSILSIFNSYSNSDKSKKNFLIYLINKIQLNPQSAVELKLEQEKISAINSEEIVKVHNVFETDKSIVMVMEDCNGLSLNEFMKLKKLNLLEILNIFIKINDLLDNLHKNGVIYKDLTPENIFFIDNGKKMKFSNAGFSPAFCLHGKSCYGSVSMEENLMYISPEQTGRINHSVDYRSDFYSLGIILYKLLTGKLPFRSNDPVELIHSHIAKKAVPPYVRNRKIPEIVSDIVMKLISKNAENRYQSSYGLKYDIEKCINELKDNGEINKFDLCKMDISDQFHFPQKLYGRENEIDSLLSVFDRVRTTGSPEMMLVSGASGAGKTALIHELNRPIIRLKGFFTFGKFEEFKKDIPYSAIIQAFQKLIKQILTESEDRLSVIRKRLIEALGGNGRIIIDVIPGVELIIGVQPSVQPLGPTETKNRFNIVFQNFIGVFSRKEHPLLIFLDDLQWIDLASLDFIKNLLSISNIQYILIIGSYRTGEVSSSHPLMLTIEEVRKSGIGVNLLRLEYMEVDSINKLISETLKAAEDKTHALAELVFRKTIGNPFFVRQFILSLYRDNMIRYVTAQGWEWDVNMINQMQATDNVVELMVNRISKLSEKTLAQLKVASCLGNTFTLETLAAAGEKTLEETFTDLSDSVDEEFIVRFDDFYIFAHDRIREAGYSLIPDSIKTQVHLNIGNRLLSYFGEDDAGTQILDIVNQLNRGARIIRDKNKKYELVKLNLIAAKKAKASTAYESARRYLSIGRDHLDNSSWDTNYDLTFNIYKELAECEYLNTNFDVAEKLFNVILSRANNRFEIADVLKTKTTLYTNINKMVEALTCGIEALKLFGFKISLSPGKFLIIKEIVVSKKLLKKQKIEDLVNSAEISDKEKIAILSILMNMVVPAYFENSNLFTLIILKMLNMSLKHGNSPISAYTYVASGVIFGSGLGDYDTGHKLGELALILNENVTNTLLNGRIFFMFGSLINHWKNHASSDAKYLLRGYQAGFESGDLIYSGYSINMYILTLICKGDPLKDVNVEIEKFSDFFKRSKNPAQLHVNQSNREFVMKLSGTYDYTESDVKDKQNDAEKICSYNIIENIKEGSWTSTDLFINYNHMSKICFLFENYDDAEILAMETEKYLEGSLGLLVVVDHYFFYSLIMTSNYFNVNQKKKKQYLKKLAVSLKKIKKWADNCPDNFDHKYFLITAEIARINGNDKEAMKFYDRAVDSALKNKYIHNAAISNELAGKFYLNRGVARIAISYLAEAKNNYKIWGAVAKVKNIERKYSEIFNKPYQSVSIRKQDYSRFALDSALMGSNFFDLSTIIKASQALSSEIILKKLLEKFMRIVIENAGAHKGYIIIIKKGDIFVEVEGSIDYDKIILSDFSLEKLDNNFPTGVINYVKRTMENVLLNDAVNEGIFTLDPYVQKNRPKSILCIPLIRQNVVTGILYLENNLTKNAFTEERFEILSVLCSQATISIENAKLYDEMSRLNIDFEQEIAWRNKVEEALDFEKENLRLINSLLVIGVKNISLEEKLMYAIEKILSTPWLSFTAKAGIFISENDNRLKLIAHFNFPENQLETCSDVPFGKCLCGKTAETGLIEYSQCSLEEHEIQYGEFEPHGHYCVPIKMEGRTLGIIILYLKESHEKDRHEVEFLQTVANTLAGIIMSKIEDDEKQKLHLQLIQSQKMESIGRMAGGVAHDFNNMLSVIIGSSELSMEKLPEGHPVREELESIKQAGEKAAISTRQLLAFSRRQILEMKVVNLNSIIEKVGILLRRMIGEDILVEIKNKEPVKNIFADPFQIEQILMNLAVNARDAMNDGGSLIIETQNIDFSEEYIVGTVHIEQGEYVMLSVSDTGVGMEKEIFENIFEPFYTTKEIGKGTGLGLSMVYGIVKQHRGYIIVKSSPGAGSSFRIYIPVTTKKIDGNAVYDTESFTNEKKGNLVKGHEAILVVEDEPYIRKLIIKILKPHGYKLFEASSGDNAVELINKLDEKIDLLLTDIVMHGINGIELAEIVKSKMPDTKVLLMSGYADSSIIDHSLKSSNNINEQTAFIQKPFTPKNLANKIRNILDNK